MFKRACLVPTLALVVLASTFACAPVEEEESAASSGDTALTSTGPKGSTPAAGATLDCQVLVVGGGTGGMAAAIAASKIGAKVCVTEESEWVGGQFTAQGLNASDDSRFTDGIGSTRTYREMRARMRAAYGGKSNPGGCWVSYLCAEPRVALDALDKMTKPAVDAGNIRIFYNLKPTGAKVTGGRLANVTFARTADGGAVTIRAKQTIDATELGDLLKLAGAGYRLGQEPRSDTGEADAPEQACPTCVQSITYDVVLEKRPTNERHVIAKPEGYGVKPWMKGFSHQNYKMFGSGSVWEYRRIVDGSAFGRTDLSIMNWGVGGNDYPFGSVVDVSAEEQAEQFKRARERALAYVYWLQTEVDGRGYPYLKMRDDILGTTNGVAKYPYIREGRRLRSLETIKVEHISDFYNRGSGRAATFPFSVGVGFYPMDMHQNVSEGTGYPRGKALPFQIPLGSLVPETMNGLLAGGKNLGTTHLTNSAYRLHPIEWAIGEAAGTLAAMCVSWNKEARDVFANEGNARELQDRMLSEGAPLYWIDDVALDSPLWKDVQFAAASGIMGGPEAGTLHFRPDATLTRAQSAVALLRALGVEPAAATGKFSDVPVTHWAAAAVEALAGKGVVSGTGDGQFSPNAPVTSEQMRMMIARSLGEAIAAKAVPSPSANAMSRGQAAQALARAYRARINLP